MKENNSATGRLDWAGPLPVEHQIGLVQMIDELLKSK